MDKDKNVKNVFLCIMIIVLIFMINMLNVPLAQCLLPVLPVLWSCVFAEHSIMITQTIPPKSNFLETYFTFTWQLRNIIFLNWGLSITHNYKSLKFIPAHMPRHILSHAFPRRASRFIVSIGTYCVCSVSEIWNPRLCESPFSSHTHSLILYFILIQMSTVFYKR